MSKGSIRQPSLIRNLMLCTGGLSLALLSSQVRASPCPVINPSPFNLAKLRYAASHKFDDLVLISAHRGSWDTYPENSGPAISQAFNQGYEVIEIDVRLTATNPSTNEPDVVLSHDYLVDRETTGKGNVSSMTLGTLQGLKLRDRAGRLYPDSTLHLLSFDEFLTCMESTTAANSVRGYLAIVDVKGAINDQDPTDPIALLNLCVGKLRGRLNPALNNEFIFKLKSKDVQSRTIFESKVSGLWRPVPSVWSPGLIIVMNPDDTNVKSASDAAADTFFNDFLGNTAAFANSPASYVTHFEMNQYYLKDKLQSYIAALDSRRAAGKSPSAYATYYEPYYFPEGVANSAGYCCFAHLTDTTTATPSSDFSRPLDYRGDPLLATNPATSLITSDGVATLRSLLEISGRRTLSRIQ